MFIVQGDSILLIRKKRGLGAGKINAPGGKIDPGETSLQAVIRETQEELCITPIEPRKLGELWFAMSELPDMRCDVYRADGFEGVPTETEEALPLWFSTDAIPYGEMWDDDQYWLPYLLQNASFMGKFLFENCCMKWIDVQLIGAEANRV